MSGYIGQALNLIPGAVSNFLGAKGDQGAAGYIPGAVTGGYSGIDSLLQIAGNIVRHAAPQLVGAALPAVGAVQGLVPGLTEKLRTGIRDFLPENIPHLPGAEEAGRLHELSIENARSKTPGFLTAPTPQSEGEQMAANAFTSIGTMAFPGSALRAPGAVARLLGSPAAAGALGAVARGAEHLIPTLNQFKVAAPLAGAFSVGSDVVYGTHGYEGPKAGETPQADPHASPRPETVAAGGAAKPQDGGLSSGFNIGGPVTDLSTDQATEPIVVGAHTTAPSDGGFSIGGPVADDGAPAAGRGGLPDFSAVAGDTGISQGAVLGSAALAALIGAGAARYHAGGAARVMLRLGQQHAAPPAGTPATPATTGAPAPGTPAAGAATPPLTRAQQAAIRNTPPPQTPRTPGEPIIVPNPGPNELPIRSTGFKRAVVDENTEINDLYRAVAETPDMARAFEASTGTVRNNASMFNWLKRQAESGVAYGSGNRITSVKDLTREIRAMEGAVERPAFNEYVNIKNELYNRGRNFDLDRTTPEHLRRTGFTQWDDVQLDDRLAEIRQAHPRVERAANIYKQITDDILNEAEHHGYRTKAELDLIRKRRGWYVPTVDETGKIKHTFGERDTTPGSRGDYINSDPMGDLAQHYDAVYKDMHMNNIARDFTDQVMKWQARNPTAQKLLIERKVPIENEYGITVYTRDGPKHYQAMHPSIARALQTNPTQLSVIGNLFNTSRKWFQSLSTGPGALLGGSFFQLKNASRNALLIPLLQQKGMVSGAADALSQRHLGVSSRAIPDPTRLIGMGDAVTRDLGALFAGRAADALHAKSGTVSGTALRKLLGDGAVDRMQMKMQHAYDTSTRAEMLGEGVGGSGAHGSMEAPSFQKAPWDSPNIRTTMSAIDPSMFRSKVAARGLNMQGLIHDINNIIGDAPISHYYRINKKHNLGNRSPQELAHAVRTVVGDPGIGGASKAMKELNAAIPYLNVSVQGLEAVTRAMKQAPVGTSAAMLSTVMIPALASLYTAMRHGPDAINHLENEVSTRQRAANVYLYGDGPAENATSISLPQELRVPYAFVMEMLSHGLGAFNLTEGSPMHERVFNTLQEVFSHRISHTSFDSMLHAAQDTLGVSVPPLANAAVNVVAGVQLEPAIDTFVSNIMNNRPMMSGMSRDLTKAHGSPNQDISNDVTGNDMAVVKSVLNNIGGVAANAFDYVQGGRNDYKEHGDVGHAVGAVANQYAQGFRDQSPMLNSVWQNPAKLAMGGPLEEKVNRQMAAIRPLATAASDVRNQGSTRLHGLPINTGEDERVPSADQPEMRAMYFTAGRVAAQIDRRFTPMVTDMRKLIEDASKHGSYYAEDQRKLINEHTRTLHEEYKKVAEQIALLNEGLSAIAGRTVDVQTIDWKKGLEQFD